MTLGLDHAGRPADYPAFARAAKEAGYDFEFRYLCFPESRAINQSKIARAAEVQAARSAGLSVALIWQDTKKDATGGYSVGRYHGAAARVQAEALAYPYGSTIYFAVGDYDVPYADLPTIRDYLDGVNEELALRYAVGAYGKRSVVEDMLAERQCARIWQSYGFSRPVGEISPQAAVYQRQEQVQVAGITCDVNEAFQDIGAWRPDMRIVLPGYTFKDLGPDGGTYDETKHVKICWHTMETMNVAAAESAYRGYPPHLGVRPPWPGQTPVKNQYIGLDRHSYSLKGSESDDEFVIQVEVAGFAKDMRTAPVNVIEWLVKEVMLPIERALGVPRVAAPQGFHDTTTAPAGTILASATSKIRFTNEGLRAFSGHMGHQHAPNPDTHWDPGALPILSMFNIARSLSSGPQTPEDDVPRATDVTASLKAPNGGRWLLQYDGGVRTNGNPKIEAPFYGSYPGLPASARIDDDGHRGFFHIEPRTDGGYSITSTDGGTYDFPKK